MEASSAAGRLRRQLEGRRKTAPYILPVLQRKITAWFSTILNKECYKMLLQYYFRNVAFFGGSVSGYFFNLDGVVCLLVPAFQVGHFGYWFFVIGQQTPQLIGQIGTDPGVLFTYILISDPPLHEHQDHALYSFNISTCFFLVLITPKALPWPPFNTHRCRTCNAL